jgi:hypothetical protein
LQVAARSTDQAGKIEYFKIPANAQIQDTSEFFTDDKSDPFPWGRVPPIACYVTVSIRVRRARRRAPTLEKARLRVALVDRVSWRSAFGGRSTIRRC